MEKRTEILIVALLIAVSSFLRFYHINRLVLFDYDQARDALYTKRLVVDHKLRLIGPQSSPGFYTGPAYYYLMSPFLFLSRLNPSGMDVGVAVFNISAVILLYFLLKGMTKDLIISTFFSFLYSIQSQVVWQSRFSWNPNLTPFFTILFIFGIFQTLCRKNWGWLVAAFSLGFLIQLHFATISLLPVAVLFLIKQFRGKFISKWSGLFLVVLIAMLSPFLAIELRHNFPNFRYLLDFMEHGPAVDLPPLSWGESFLNPLKFVFAQLPLGVENSYLSIMSVVVSLVVVVILWKQRKMRDQLLIIVSPILFLILFSLVYRFSFFQYYLTFLYPLPYLLLGVVFSFWLQKRGIKIYLFLLIFLPGIIINLNKNFTLFSMTSVREELNEVAKSVASHIRPGESFNIVSLRKGSGYYNGVDYRYFLETFYHQKALDWDIIGYQESQVLYFVSHQGEFEPLSSNIWEICLFKPRKIIQRWEVGDNVIVYKLVK